jgi:hypothetical protein
VNNVAVGNAALSEQHHLLSRVPGFCYQRYVAAASFNRVDVDRRCYRQYRTPLDDI